MGGLKIPLADVADAKLRGLANAAGSSAIAAINGATLLGERAMLQGFAIPGSTSAGGACRLYPTFRSPGGELALNLARDDDRDLLPAWLEEDFDPTDDVRLATLIARRDPAELLARGREIGLALAAVHEPQLAHPAPNPSITFDSLQRPPKILDLSALWAGPLAAHLLALAGAEVIKAESRMRPDAMREGQPAFFALLNAAKRQIAIDWHRDALLPRIAEADIVIEAARPRALLQLGIDADALIRKRPGLIWISITAHGHAGDAANWIGFGDDVAVAAGLSAELARVTGRAGFVGDAIADPLTGIEAAAQAWQAWSDCAGGRYQIAMRAVVEDAIAAAKASDPAGFDDSLRAFAAAEGQPFPTVRDRRC